MSAAAAVKVKAMSMRRMLVCMDSSPVGMHWRLACHVQISFAVHDFVLRLCSCTRDAIWGMCFQSLAAAKNDATVRLCESASGTEQ